MKISLKKLVSSFVGVALILSGLGIAHAAPTVEATRSMIPFTDSLYYIGTNVLRYSNIFTDNASTTNLTIDGLDCTGNANGGALTTNATGDVSCSDDDNDAAVWGSITGTLSNQTDLQTALDAKFSLSAWYATTTDALAEGSTNFYYTDARFNTTANASSTVGHNLVTVTGENYLAISGAGQVLTVSAVNLAGSNVTGILPDGSFDNTGAWDGTYTAFGSDFYTFFSATNTDALSEGSTNKYYSTLLFATDLAGTTTDALTEGAANLYNQTHSGEVSGATTLTIADSIAVSSWNLTTPTLTSFFGTPCAGQNFLQDISDTGAFSCGASTDTTYTASGILLDLTGTVFSINEGTLTDENLCKYDSTGTQLECETNTSSELATIITDSTGSGALTFATTPTFTTNITVTGSGVMDADGIDLVSGNDYEINGTAVLNATTLGGAVVNSSLTNVGTLTALTVSATIAADGLTIGSTELITIGSNTFTHDATTFVFNDDIAVTGTATSTFSGGIYIATTTPDTPENSKLYVGGKLIVDDGTTGTTTVSHGDIGNPACDQYRDSDDAGWTRVYYLNGVKTEETGTCE